MKKNRNYHLIMPEVGYEALQEIASKEKRVFADIIREALQEYTKRKGYKISFEVDRGGYRGDQP